MPVDLPAMGRHRAATAAQTGAPTAGITEPAAPTAGLPRRPRMGLSPELIREPAQRRPPRSPDNQSDSGARGLTAAYPAFPIGDGGCPSASTNVIERCVDHGQKSAPAGDKVGDLFAGRWTTWRRGWLDGDDVTRRATEAATTAAGIARSRLARSLRSSSVSR